MNPDDILLCNIIMHISSQGGDKKISNIQRRSVSNGRDVYMVYTENDQPENNDDDVELLQQSCSEF